MRYLRTETISFTNANGKTVAIKAMREYESTRTSRSIRVTGEDSLDEIATRQDVWGERGYRQAYLLFDHNRVAMVEQALDLGSVRTLDIPRV